MIAPPDTAAALSACDGIAEVAAGRLTADLWQAACVERIRAAPDVRAWAHLPSRPLRAAERGPLAGLPVGVKDVIDVAGMPTGCNSALEDGRPAPRHAAVIDRLLAAGAQILGKTTTTEYAFIAPAETVNPHDHARTPGGSSSGSAAAVADFQVPVALTTQTGGSTIRPAAFCGIVGYKPAYGRVPSDGLHFLSPGFDVIGLHARSIEDIECVASVIEARRFPKTKGGETPFVLVELPGQDQADAAATGVLDLVATHLATAGPPVRRLSLKDTFAGLDAAHRVIMAHDMARVFAKDFRDRRALMSGSLGEFVEWGTGLGAADVARALATVATARQDLADLVSAEEALLCIPAPGEAPVGLGATGSSVFNRPWSLMHNAVLTHPAGTGPAGLPLGIQIVDARPSGTNIFNAARQVRQAIERTGAAAKTMSGAQA